MSRTFRYAVIAIAALMIAGCHTSEVKNGNWMGLADDVPTGTAQSGYGDGKGDSVGGGGASEPMPSKESGK